MKNKKSQQEKKIENIKKQVESRLSIIESKKKEAAEKIRNELEQLNKLSEKFRDEVLKKYKTKIKGIIAIPSQSMDPASRTRKELKAELLILLEIKSKKDILEKLKEKIEIDKDIQKLAKKHLKDYHVNLLLLDELWDMCLKSKYEILNLVSMGLPLYETGFISALKLIEIHKMKMIQKFEKYVVSYVFAGSMVRGDITPESDIDTYVVIDDTDVTRMTSNELRNRLLATAYQYAHEAEAITGVKNKLNVQVYILTDMWNSIKNAHPVIFTFLRDGIPLYDRGMFAPWKLLLKKGKITPSPEAIDQYIKSGKQIIERTKNKLKEIAVEDFFWATVTPTQGALMMLGIPPGVPKELSNQLREHLFNKGLIEAEYIDIWEQIFRLRKDIEHGKIKDISGKTIQEMIDLSEKYLKRIDRLFEELEKDKISELITNLYEKTMEDSFAALSLLGISSTSKKELVLNFKKNIVEKNLAPKRYLDVLKKIERLNKTKKATRQEIASLEFEQSQLIKDIFDIIRAEKGLKIEKYKVNLEFNKGKNNASMWLLGDCAYIASSDLRGRAKIAKYSITKKGELTNEKLSTLAEMDKAVTTFSGKPTTITHHTIDSLKKILSEDIQIVIGV